MKGLMPRSSQRLLFLKVLPFILWLSAPAMLLCAAGCDLIVSEDPYEPAAVAGFAPRAAPDERTLYGRLQSSDRNVRIEAAVEAGRRKDAKAVPYLIDRLSDGYAEVRFAAVVALQKITGTSRGYRYWAPTAEREEAVARWRDWLRKGRPADVAEDPR